MFEVELKFPVGSHDSVLTRLQSMETTVEPTRQHCDEYFNHSLLDFAQQDIALRIRSRDDQRVLTYKGPNLDPRAKVREEIELSLNPDEADRFRKMLFGMGFHSVAVIEKQRDSILTNLNDQAIEVCLDCVQPIGQFIELEVVVANQSEIPAAKQLLEQFADALGITTAPTTTSYLEMLIQGGHV